MTWVFIVVAAWVVLAVAAALLIGRTVHTADVIEHTEDPAAPSHDSEPPAAGEGFVIPRARSAFVER